jgi:lysophospholipase L1-like esterase
MRVIAKAMMALVAAGFVGLTARAEDRFLLEDGDRIVFFGDSITQAGGYIADLETYLLTRFPRRAFAVFNRGLSSETISGTSEADHHPRRPDAHKRFTRDVAAWRPTVVVACFGMNDGNYHPFEPGRFLLYQKGIQRLIDRTRMEAGAKLVLASPPPFDAYRRSVGDPHAIEYGYKFPAVDYDRTLEAYSRWLMTLAGRDPMVTVVDVHSALAQHLAKRRAGQVSFFLAGDAVHPGSTGHWLMAEALLLAWHAPAVVDEAAIDATEKGPRAIRGSIRDLERTDEGGIRFTWRSGLPMAIDDAWDARSLELEQLSDRLNRYRLTIKGLEASKYRVLARLEDGGAEAEAGVVSGRELADGLDLTRLKGFPTVALARRVRMRVLERRRAIDAEWRRQIGSEPERSVDRESAAFRCEDADLLEIRRICGLHDVHVRVVPGG